ncbi:MAG: T9SS type A sorting domain-containing protein [Cyclonatronaceae bacterium]
MKTVLLFALLLLSQTAFAQYNLPVTFNDTEVTYTVTDFGGNASQIVTDPTNAENTVVQTVKTAAAELWAGTTIGDAASFFDALPFSPSLATMTVRVWSPDAGIPVRLKVETFGDPTRSVETEAITTVAGEWEVLTFDFRNEATGTAAINYSYTYNTASIFFNFGATGAVAGEKTYYWDDVALGEADEPVIGGITLPVDFEDEDVDWDNAFTNFDGGNLTRIANPDQSGINNSANVARMVKGAGQPWGGSYFVLAENIDLNAGTNFTVKGWSPRADAQMLFKIENEFEGSQNFEIGQTIGVAEEWTELTFDISGANPAFEYKKIVVIFDLGTTGDGSANFTWYFDDIVQTEGTIEPGTAGIYTLPVTFDDPEVEYVVTDFGGNASTVVADPTNTENTVVQTVKTASAELWAGTTIGDVATFTEPLPFTPEEAMMNVRVWSPDAGIPVRLKVEDADDPTRSVETETVTTVAGEWETLQFDFQNEATGTAAIDYGYVYNKASIFFNFGTTGAIAGEKTYYWDDVALGAAGEPVIDGITFPVDFEDEDVDWENAFTNFDGGNLTRIANPDQSGINNSGNVARMIKGAGQPWGGSYFVLAENIDLNAGNHFTVKVWSPRADAQMTFKIENETDGAQALEIQQAVGVAEEWTELTFDMSGANPAFEYKKIVVIFDNGTPGDGSANFTWYFDDITQVMGDPGMAGITMPVDFEDEDVDWENAFTNFDGGNLTRIVNPDQSGINNSAHVARMVKGAGQPWGGSFFSLDEVINLELGTAFSVKVWSPRADAKMLFKIENETVGSQAFEVDQVIGAANEWTEVVFDMSGANMTWEYKKLVVIFELGTVGDGSENFTFYFDDITQQAGSGLTGPPYTLPVTFDQEDVNYVVTDFGGNASEIVTDPTDPENTVVQTTKTSSAELWAGTTIGQNASFTERLPFTAQSASMSVRVWSPDAGIPVRLKVEDANDPTLSVETEALTTVAEEWEVLVFDFQNEATGTAEINYGYNYNKASIFFNFGATGADAGEKTYYWDDVTLIGGEPGEGLIVFPVTFENDEVDWNSTFTNFDGGNLTRITNPDKSGINASDHVARMIKGAGQVWGGAYFSMDNVIDMDLSTEFTVKVWSPRADAQMLFKIENQTNGAQAWEVQQPVGVAGEWTELAFDMSGANMTWDYQKVVIIFDLGTVGDGSANFTFYIDDIDQKTDTSIEGPASELPTQVALGQNYPNPFNPTTQIAFDLPESSEIRLDVYNVMGQRVATLIDGNMQAGSHQVTFNAAHLANGVYLYRLQTGTQSFTRKMTLLK